MGPIPLSILCKLFILINSKLSSAQLLGPPQWPGPPGPLPGPPGPYPGPPGSFPGPPGPFPGPPETYPGPVGGLQRSRTFHHPTYPRGHQETQSLIFESVSANPDSYVQKTILINGQFPGPKIKVRMYDVLIVEVINRLDHGIALHFHGMRNYGASGADGVPKVTQELIPPGTSFRYRLNIGFQTGTFMYHLHNGLDIIGAVGPLIIDDGPELLKNHPEYYHYWDHTFILQQWYHTPNSQMLEGIEGSPYKELPEADSILINGQSHGQWNESNSLTPRGYEVLTVKPGEIYRFRVIGFAADSILTFKITNHTMKIFEVDGIIVKPTTVDHLQVNSGQRYSVLVKMDQPPDNYLIESEMVPGPGPKNGKAILNYQGVESSEKLIKKVESGKTPKVELTQWETTLDLSPNEVVQQPDIYLPPTTVDKEIIIKSHQKKTANGSMKIHVNGEVYKDPSVPWLLQVTDGINITKEPQVFESLTNKSIQIVFQNVASEDGKCEQHPWNLHGHSFYIVGQGPGEYDKEKDGKAINKRVEDEPKKLVFRDVVTLYPSISSESNSKSIAVIANGNSTVGNSTLNPTVILNTKNLNDTATGSPNEITLNTTATATTNSNATTNGTGNTTAVSDPDPDKFKSLKEGTPCGWVAIRFVTDNPGVWLAHCHFAAHLVMGKEFVLYAHQEHDPKLTFG